MGPIWGRQEPGGPHVGPMNFVTWAIVYQELRMDWLLLHPANLLPAMLTIARVYVSHWSTLNGDNSKSSFTSRAASRW